MVEMKEQGWGSPGRLVIGIYLIVIGGLVLASNFGYDIPGELWSYWPFLLIGLGTVKLLWPAGPDERGGGFWLLVAGIYCWVSMWRAFGLHWRTAWPIFLVAGGIAIVFRGFCAKQVPAGSDGRVG